MDNSKDSQFDAIVAGTGPGGATVARELTLRGKKVLLLEMGGYPRVIKGSPIQTLRTMRHMVLSEGLTVVSQVATGGATFSYYACALDPNFDMLERHGVNIRTEVEEVKRELPYGPLPDHLIGPMAKRIWEAALSLGYDWQKIPKFIDPDKCKAGCAKCTYNCPDAAKWTARMYVEEVVKKGGMLINKATADKVIIENGKAIGMEYTVGRKRQRVLAPLVIVSAGGVGTPLILRRTGIKEAGYDFFIDPVLTAIGFKKGVKDGAAEIPMTVGDNFVDEGYLMTDMTMPQSQYRTSTVRRPTQVARGKSALVMMIKVKDGLGGALDDEGGGKKTIPESDIKKIYDPGYQRAVEILKKAGAEDIIRGGMSGGHPGGTAKIDDVVDANLQTKYQNLYVCDCSVIPEAWGLPPVLTLVALGKRLVKHITGTVVEVIRH